MEVLLDGALSLASDCYRHRDGDLHRFVKKNRALSRAEAERLLRELAVTGERHRCPHGRPILLRLPHAEIERRIGRK